MTDRLAIFRADASRDVGTGHVIRSRTLAQALVGRGWTTMLAARELPTSLAGSWPGGEAAVVRLPPDLAPASEPALIAARAGRASLVVGDGYRLDAAWCEGMRDAQPGALLMAIDDLADRPLPVDLLLNQNLGAGPDAYAGLVPDDAQVLIGPVYALLRPEFAALRDRGRVRDGAVTRILVFMSGADGPDVTQRATAAVAGLGLPFDVVVGASYQHLSGLREQVAGLPQATLHVNVPDIADLMAGADLANGAPSSASWERCALGLPTLLVILAQTQVSVGEELDRLGAGLLLGWHTATHRADIEAAVRALCADRDRVAAMSGRAAAVTDGRGVDRVLSAIDAGLSGRMVE